MARKRTRNPPAPIFEADFVVEVDDDDVRHEKAKAKELRNTQWWKNKRASGQCHYCRQRFPAKELTMDHVVPLIRGGKTTKSNVVPCCKSCNDKKSYLLPIEWQEYLDALSATDPSAP